MKNIEVKTKKENKKWLSKELRSLINEKHRVFNEWKKDPNQELFNSYNVLRNNVNRKLRKASDDYTKHFFDNLPTSKEQWKFIKNKINSNKQTEEITKLKEGHNVISDKKKHCLLFEKLFCPSWTCKLSIGTHLQFAINECINANTFPEILEEAYVTPI